MLQGCHGVTSQLNCHTPLSALDHVCDEGLSLERFELILCLIETDTLQSFPPVPVAGFPRCDPPAVRGVLFAAPHDGIVPGRLGRGRHDAVIATPQGLL